MNDHERYHWLVGRLSVRMDAADWKELETLKNRHGGFPPRPTQAPRRSRVWLTQLARLLGLKTALLLLVSASPLFSLSAFAQTIPASFFKALHTVETSGRTGAIVGDGGRALGPYQIHRAYWQDSRIPGTYGMVTNEAYARRVVTAYLTRYGRDAIARGDLQTLARIHNGGPSGATKPATLPYWNRVRRHLP